MADRQSLPLVLLFLFLLSAAADSQEADALLKFKEGISDPANNLHTWDSKSSPCNRSVSNWAGVTCERDGVVSGLRLEKMGLSGVIDAGVLASLPHLRMLSLKNNKFEGAMPEVGRISTLRALFLSKNKFSGEIPDNAFTGVNWLRKLHLSRNELSGAIPASIAGLPKLLELDLDSNRLNGTIPDLKSKELKIVDLRNNELEGSIPESLSKMKADFFSGNKGLCGEPLKVECPSAVAPAAPSLSAPSTFPPIVAAGIAGGAILAIIALVLLVRRSQQNDPSTPPINSRRAKTNEEKLEEGTVRSEASSTCGTRRVEQRLIFVRETNERFELRDLLKSSAEVLGNANFGCSYKASLVSGTLMVVKRFRNMNRVGKEDFGEHMRRLGRLSHPNLLPLVAYYYRKDEKLLVTNYVPKKSLANILHGPRSSDIPSLDWSTRIKIVKGVTKGLNYLYEELQMLSVPHGHLKSSNVLINDSFEPLLTDYALVPVMNQIQATEFMTAYMSPECKKNGKASKKSDIWSLGILILEILTGKSPITELRQDKGGVDLVNWVSSVPQEEWTSKVLDNEMRLTANGEEEVIKLLKIGLSCCVEDAERRLELEEVLDRIEELKEIAGEQDYIKNMENGNQGESCNR